MVLRRSATPTSSMGGFHTALLTHSMDMSVAFYSLFGFTPVHKFKTSGARAAWLQSNFLEGNLEVIEIPSHMIQSTPKKCNNLEEKGAPGLYHISFDVTASCLTLSTLLQELDAQSRLKFNKTLRILEPPAQRMLGSLTCEICFLSDPNNIPVELIRRISQLAHPMEPDW
uniref:VOC domain-containing protein n=1 Tax=Compsopogon caeruleus TaxID=31354 RepID=A0A7S1TAM8_9RHOD|mmetsp:Transcript_14481/g.29610  ORF Transcript_14481/g.29610 Transcript_14481/m.29610 type:complete len:170 (+) Transcript_14481:640-1149(+)